MQKVRINVEVEHGRIEKAEPGHRHWHDGASGFWCREQGCLDAVSRPVRRQSYYIVCDGDPTVAVA